MTLMSASLTVDDEQTHSLPDHELNRESFYFEFGDAGGRLGGTVYVGVRPAQGYAEGFCFVLFEKRRIFLYRIKVPLDEGATLFKMGGVQQAVVVPMLEWHVQAGGDFLVVDPYTLIHAESTPTDTLPVKLEFTFKGLGSIYEYPPDPNFVHIVGESRHYEQTGRVEGQVVLGEEVYPFAGFGARDHSWGIRDWAKSGNVMMYFAQFGAHFTVDAFWGENEGRVLTKGYIFQAGRNIPLVDFIPTVEYDPESHLPVSGRASLTTEDGQQFTIEATPLVVAPVIMSQGNFRMFWFECFSRFTCGGETGYGMFEITQFQ